MTDPVPSQRDAPPSGQLPAFWTTAAYRGGLLGGIGVGFLLAGLGTLFPILPVERFGAVAVILGGVLIVLGGIKARSRP